MLKYRKHQGEGGALPFLTARRYQATVSVHDLFNNGQANASPFKFVVPMQPLEDDEYFIEVLFVEPDPVVGYRNAAIRPFGIPASGYSQILCPLCTDSDFRNTWRIWEGMACRVGTSAI